MPFSSESGKALVDRAILRLTTQYSDIFFRTRRILDIGPGSGTYSKRYRSQLKGCKWTGIEIWEPYIKKYQLHELYDHLIVDSGLSFLRLYRYSDNNHDICFMGDVIEHMTKEEAVEMIQLALQKARVVIVSVPIIHYPQDEYDGNPYEKHVKDDWTHQEALDSLPHVAWYGVENEIGVYFCSLEPLLIQQALAPLVAVYGICKNETKFIDDFYKSVSNADLLTICDTGSTDGTYDKLRDYVKERVHLHGHEEEFKENAFGATDGAMTVKKIHVSPWRFDDARNAALALVPPEADMCISIDIDERLQTDWKELLEAEILKDLQTYGKVHDRYNHRFQTIWDWQTGGFNFTEHWHERIHARNGFKWKLPVHEILVKDGPETSIWLGGWWMTQLPDTSKSRSSYLELLELSVTEDPSVWKSWSFYGVELQNAGRFDEALAAFHKGCVAPNADLAYLTMQTARVYEARGDIWLAADRMSEAYRKLPSRELAVYASDLFKAAGDEYNAKQNLIMAVKHTAITSSYLYNPKLWEANALESRLLALGIE